MDSWNIHWYGYFQKSNIQNSSQIRMKEENHFLWKYMFLFWTEWIWINQFSFDKIYFGFEWFLADFLFVVVVSIVLTGDFPWLKHASSTYDKCQTKSACLTLPIGSNPTISTMAKLSCGNSWNLPMKKKHHRIYFNKFFFVKQYASLFYW